MRIKRRINQTGRKKIPRENVEIRLSEPRGVQYPSMMATLRLDDLGLPDDAKVYVEAYHKSSRQRFSYGTVQNPVREEPAILDDIDLGGGLLFQVKVVLDGRPAGRIVASSSGIPAYDPQDDNSRDSLIKVKSLDLGERTWDIDLPANDDGKPTLLLNSRVPEVMLKVRTDPIYQGLILPAVVRSILTTICWQHEHYVADIRVAEDGDIQSSWIYRWLQMGSELAEQSPPTDREEIPQWIDDVMDAFCSRFGLASRLGVAVGGDA